jgi:putative ABC transport system substrate-binding protein
MKRREFMALLGGVLAASCDLPFAVCAQERPSKIVRIGIIDDSPMWNDYRQGLRAAGYIEGRNLTFAYRVAEGKPERLAMAAAELARLPVDLIATYGTPATQAAKAATSTIPTVFISVGDPVAAGLVQSLAHPGGNITGNTIISPDLAPKRLQLVKEVIPSATRVGLLWNPDNTSNRVIYEEFRAASPAQGLDFTAAEARTADELESALASLAAQRPNAVFITSDPVHQSHMQKIITLLFRFGLPAMFQSRDNVAIGGLMSYGASFPDMFRQGAFFTDKILQGAKPADLPVQTPQKFSLSINLKTAKAIGLTISDDVLLRADEVIE